VKITDNELLQAIWENQLRRLSTAVVHRYIGGTFGICMNNQFWYQAASSEHVRSRHRIQTPIGPGQLRTRLRALANARRIATDFHQTYGSFLTFYIDTLTALQAFNDARQFWLDNGVPEGQRDGKQNTAPVPELDALAEQCAAMLLEKHPTYSDDD